eukprot:TRINITY_DN20071_c0_g1_i2.p2 TRINITY_DN20071_c0_g1~~TRINITY_DN20071_c0_g1_i2.p2  ORF type:complete len:181 (-),score=20.42 TRINITY_DN20071_c0_g1_i2:295-837(-)
MNIQCWSNTYQNFSSAKFPPKKYKHAIRLLKAQVKENFKQEESVRRQEVIVKEEQCIELEQAKEALKQCANERDCLQNHIHGLNQQLQTANSKAETNQQQLNNLQNYLLQQSEEDTNAVSSLESRLVALEKALVAKEEQVAQVENLLKQKNLGLQDAQHRFRELEGVMRRMMTRQQVLSA